MQIDEAAYGKAVQAYWESAAKREDNLVTLCGLDLIAAIEAYEAAKTPAKDQPVDCIDAIKNGIAEARSLFAADPSDFNGELGDDDLVAFIQMAIHRRTPKPEPATLTEEE